MNKEEMNKEEMNKEEMNKGKMNKGEGNEYFHLAYAPAEKHGYVFRSFPFCNAVLIVAY